MSIYTRTGDTGMTALFGGKRVLKCEELVDVYGSIDELNSWVGLIIVREKRQETRDRQQEIGKLLEDIQSDLFTIGSTLAGWKEGDLTILSKRVEEMEKVIDGMEKELPAITNFILPGGSELAAQVHIARSICRRVERQMVALKVRDVQKVREVKEEDMDIFIKYFNRLSDLFFMIARFINKNEKGQEIIWQGTKKIHK